MYIEKMSVLSSETNKYYRILKNLIQNNAAFSFQNLKLEEYGPLILFTSRRITIGTLTEMFMASNGLNRVNEFFYAEYTRQKIKINDIIFTKRYIIDLTFLDLIILHDPDFFHSLVEKYPVLHSYPLFSQGICEEMSNILLIISSSIIAYPTDHSAVQTITIYEILHRYLPLAVIQELTELIESKHYPIIKRKFALLHDIFEQFQHQLVNTPMTLFLIAQFCSLVVVDKFQAHYQNLLQREPLFQRSFCECFLSSVNNFEWLAEKWHHIASSQPAAQLNLRNVFEKSIFDCLNEHPRRIEFMGMLCEKNPPQYSDLTFIHRLTFHNHEIFLNQIKQNHEALLLKACIEKKSPIQYSHAKDAWAWLRYEDNAGILDMLSDILLDEATPLKAMETCVQILGAHYSQLVLSEMRNPTCEIGDHLLSKIDYLPLHSLMICIFFASLTPRDIWEHPRVLSYVLKYLPTITQEMTALFEKSKLNHVKKVHRHNLSYLVATIMTNILWVSYAITVDHLKKLGKDSTTPPQPNTSRVLLEFLTTLLLRAGFVPFKNTASVTALVLQCVHDYNIVSSNRLLEIFEAGWRIITNSIDCVGNELGLERYAQYISNEQNNSQAITQSLIQIYYFTKSNTPLAVKKNILSILERTMQYILSHQYAHSQNESLCLLIKKWIELIRLQSKDSDCEMLELKNNLSNWRDYLSITKPLIFSGDSSQTIYTAVTESLLLNEPIIEVEGVSEDSIQQFSINSSYKFK
ncbi:MAG: hypothetical protein FJ161_01815 [Gammaproteobacteria bacterium]|nr:hypothetical protein [Gammaproteobacteria bacterium]